MHLESPIRFAALSCMLLAGDVATAQTTWFPLQPGLRWIYEEEGRGNTLTVTVKRAIGDTFAVDYHGTEVILTGAIDIDLPGEGPQPFYRFEDDSWLHRDFRSCEDRRFLTVTSRSEEVRTPFGILENCLRIEFEGGPCADSGIFAEWWAPEVGLVKWEEGSFIGTRTWVLRESYLGEPVFTFMRGDAGGDAIIDLSDATGILEWLYLETPGPECPDAADANDDGGIDVADVLLLLFHLFIGDRHPSPPGPDICGDDPTGDGLTDCAMNVCGG